MARTKRLVKSFTRLIFPVILLLILAFAAVSVWLVHKTATEEPRAAYLVTPEKYGLLSTRGAKITDETWSNRDGTQTRGWLLRGAANMPAVVLLHQYGADRSYVINLGVKINEATNFTILMPDLRGHGESPLVKKTSFGGSETQDALSALEFLRSLKTEDKNALVGREIGIYGVELGAFAGMLAAAKDENVKSLVLDSVPLDSDEVLAGVVRKRFPFAANITSKIAAAGTYPYFYDGSYTRESLCDAAKQLADRKVLLLAGADAPQFQASTEKLKTCFTNQAGIESKSDLTPSAYGMSGASVEQSESYDQRVIEFFKRTLTSE